MATTKSNIGNAKAAELGPQVDAIGAGESAAAAQTPEEREEELAEREAALYAREQRLAALEDRVLDALEKLDRADKGKPSAADLAEEPAIEYDKDGREIPRLDLSMPYGTIIGDPGEAGFVQNGHRFSKDRRYLCEEPKGVGKPFNIAMLGLVKVVRQAA